MSMFSIKDYYRMGKARGLRLPVQYFFQNHLFDLVHHTDTHFRLEKKDYAIHPEGFDSGILYMSSVTKEVKSALQKVKNLSKDRFFDFQFFDLGCGKGKSILLYTLLYGNKAKHKAIGVEYYEPLAEIARKNLDIIRKTNQAQIEHSDARQFSMKVSSDRLIIYLYNPFGEEILEAVLQSCSDKEVFVIYTDPAHHQVLLSHGFKPVFSKTGHFPNRNTTIYYNRS